MGLFTAILVSVLVFFIVLIANPKLGKWFINLVTVFFTAIIVAVFGFWWQLLLLFIIIHFILKYW